MSLPKPTTASDDAGRLAGAWEAHLAREETLLHDTLDSLRRVRAALLGRDPIALPELVPLQTQVVADQRELLRIRERLRLEWAAALELAPGDVTVGRVARSLPAGLRAPLLETRGRLLRLACEVEALVQANAALVRHRLDLFQHLLARLTGANPGPRYGPQGRRRDAAFGPLIQARG